MKSTSAQQQSPLRVLPPRDASILALLAQHPDAPASKVKDLYRFLSSEGQEVARALKPNEKNQKLSSSAVETASGLKQWVRDSIGAVTHKTKSAGRYTRSTASPRTRRKLKTSPDAGPTRARKAQGKLKSKKVDGTSSRSRAKKRV